MLDTCPIHHAPIPPETILLSLAQIDVNPERKWLVGWFTAGLFALVAVVASSVLIAFHLRNWSRPPLQRHIVRILFMVPSYAVCAFVSYRFPDAALYINLYRDLYEGFAVYSFFNLCLLYLGHTWDQQRESMRTSERGVGRKRCPPPLCCFTYDPKHPRFLVYCKLGICQLLVMRSLTCIGTLLLDYWNLFCPESMSPKFGHVYIVILNLASMGLSMFTLLSFYLAVHHDLPPGRPIYQFLAIKLVLFISYLQSFILAVLVALGYLQGNGEEWTTGEVVNAVASFLTCVEMAGAAGMNWWAFSWGEFRVPEGVDSEGVLQGQVQEEVEAGNNQIPAGLIRRMQPVRTNSGRPGTGVYGVLVGDDMTVRLSVQDAVWDVIWLDDLWEDGGLVIKLLGRLRVCGGSGDDLDDDEDYEYYYGADRRGRGSTQPLLADQNNDEQTSS
ncbi:hypothetical protein HDU79_005386 [Rhizoclosmatium sp. JEL0117]|nr:hypothetical protein HDU79_005386 [Rhizoclosmatium sp. JEL0117]